MKKLNAKERDEYIKKLRPFWKKRQELVSKFSKEQRKLEKEMNKNFKVDLEFFYTDGECCGIGAEHFDDRKWFPLIMDSEFS